MTLKLRPYDLHWLEEPIFPPEDFAAIARLRAGTGVADGGAARTTARPSSSATCSPPSAVDYAQPSVTKVGGVTEFLKVATLADAAGVTADAALALFRAGLPRHLAADSGARPPDGMIERYHMDLEASLYGELVTPVNGGFVVPTGPGLGRDPIPTCSRRMEAGKDFRTGATRAA